MSKLIKIGIDPSGIGTTAIAVFEDNKLIDKKELKNSIWSIHFTWIMEQINEIKLKYINEIIKINMENCLYTNASGSKDRDDLLRLIGGLSVCNIYGNISPHHTKSVVKNMENLSKYRKITAIYGENNLLIYEHGKRWKYNNEKISNHLRDAIIIANYEG